MSVVTPTYLARRCGASAASHVLTGVTIPAGKLAIVRGALSSDTITASVTDSASNTWSVQRFTSAAIGGNTECFIAYSVLTSPLSSGTVTVTLSAAAGLVTDIGYFDSNTGWLPQASVLDKTSGGTFNLVAPWSSGPTATTTQADELLIGVAACGNFNGSSSTETAPWTEEADAICSSAANTRLVSQWRKVTATGAYAAQGTWGATEFGCAGIATFKTAVGGTAYTRTPADPFGLTDARAKAVGKARADVLGLTDAATPVRTPGGPQPPVTSGLAIWLDASRLGLADGATIDSWPNLANPTLAGSQLNVSPYRPVLRANALNGRPVARFPVNSGLRWSGTGIDLNWTVIYVGHIVTYTGSGRIVTSTYPPSNLLVGYWSLYEDVAYVEAFLTPDAKKPQTSEWRMYSATGEGTPGDAKAWFYNDGVFLSGNHPVTGGWKGYFNLNGYNASGVEETCECEVAEVVMYDRRLTDTERQQVEGYLRAKWMLPPFPRQIKVVL